jgi:hypothetical protein
LWIYANTFATTFFFNGLQQLSQWVHTDLLIAVPAWFSGYRRTHHGILRFRHGFVRTE